MWLFSSIASGDSAAEYMLAKCAISQSSFAMLEHFVNFGERVLDSPKLSMSTSSERLRLRVMFLYMVLVLGWLVG